MSKAGFRFFRYWISVLLPAELCHSFINSLDNDVDFFLAYDERWNETENVSCCVVDENVAVLVAEVNYRLSGRLIELDTVDHTEASDFL